MEMNESEPPAPSMTGNLGELRRRGWQLFESGDFVGAAAVFQELSDLDLIGEPELQALVELLIDRGDQVAAIEALNRAIERWQTESDERFPLSWLAELFDLVIAAGVDAEQRRSAALRLLEGIASTGDEEAWVTMLDERRLTDVEQSFTTTLEMLDALEQEANAPLETGLSVRARAMIEEIGHVNASDAQIARAAERLLHALGQTSAAYRVERARRSAAKRGEIPAVEPASEPDVDMTGLSIVLAGGHPALRAMIERDLGRAGVARVRAIPSAKEASRVGRDVHATIAGNDLVVLLVRQLAHSTSDQVRRAAARAGVPVVAAESAGIGGVRRAIERYLRERAD
jgi:hypothetical protein